MRVSQRLRCAWERLVTPSARLQEAGLQHQARLLASLQIVVLVLGVQIESFLLIFSPATDRSDWLVIPTLLLLGLAFALNRAGRLAASAWITIVVQSLAIFIITFFPSNGEIEVDFLTFLFVPLLFAGMFLAEKLVLVLAGLFLLVIGLSPVFIPGAAAVDVLIGPVPFVTLASGMIYLIIHHRNVLEEDRRRELVEKEERYRTLLETSYEGICISGDGKVLDANPNFARMFGRPLSEVLGEAVSIFLPPALQPEGPAGVRPANGQAASVAARRKDGSVFYIEMLAREQAYRGRPAQVIAIRDITDRVNAQADLNRRERLYRSLFESANDAIFLINLEGQYAAANQQAADLLGYDRDELTGKHLREFVRPDEHPDSEEKKRVLLDGQTLPIYERTMRAKSGAEIPVEINASLIRDNDGEPLFIQSVVRDISQRKQAEARIQRQLQSLAALRAIDIAITSSLDLRVIFDVLLDKVITLLGLDAADMLLFNAPAQSLEFAAGRGFRTQALEHTRLRLGEGYAGRAALARQVIHIPDLRERKTDFLRSPNFKAEGFVTYYAVPLIAKGHVKGVLEVFQRAIFDPDREWLDLLEALAGQAAIALDNAGLFGDLQQSNTELVLAYDTTIEGWSRALDLRDRETEGHSQRVTEMTAELARRLGMNAADLAHVRRGSLLHDIGKMGIPDQILLKPGPLTDEEWEIMRQHPVYAYELLSPISYLRPALDIPYCHHEKWDGSGYPRGLKGEQIPLAARVFSIVDVWDALSSDRPYRRAWRPEKVRAYLQEQSGVHFDPGILRAFLDILDRASQVLPAGRVMDDCTAKGQFTAERAENAENAEI
jgi:PAS domain S-box-containing protein/putative nucleotidyltransferase with HDIG domain